MLLCKQINEPRNVVGSTLRDHKKIQKITNYKKVTDTILDEKVTWSSTSRIRKKYGEKEKMVIHTYLKLKIKTITS